MIRYTLLFLIGLITLFLISCSPEKPTEERPTKNNPIQEMVLAPMLDFTVAKKYPHDVTCFTEGFLFYDNKLYESTGAPENLPQTKSSIGFSNLENGKFELKVELNKNQYFGEGIVVFNNNLYQLTYTNQVGFIYDAKTFQQKGQFGYQNKQGWGFTTDGTSLIMSDGTNVLTYLNPSNQTPLKTINVTENGFALDYLNELEYIKGYIYANVWMTNFIVKIDPTSGKVVGKLDLTQLYNESKKSNIYLLETNGIAYNAESDKILVTGKLWPDIYEINFAH